MDDPKIIEFENCTWKWCDKCFGGCWNRTHITSEHQPEKGHNKNRKTTPTNTTEKKTLAESPQPSPPNNPTNEANIAATSDYTSDFV